MMTGSSGLAMECTLADDLLEDRRCHVFAGRGLANGEILFILHHRGEVVEGQVGSGARTVKPAAGIPLDKDRSWGWGHIGGHLSWGPRRRSRPTRWENRRFLFPGLSFCDVPAVCRLTWIKGMRMHI